MLFYCGILIASISILQGSYGQETCLAASGVQGTCIGIADCASLFNVLRQAQNLPASETSALKNSQCGVIGTTPKVCCPKDTPGSALPPRSGEQISETPPDVRNHPKIGLINKPNCGPVTETKIILGNKTQVLEFPWMALIGYKVNGQLPLEYECGGTLITKRYVLTAGHCVTGLPQNRELGGVRLGEHDLNKEKDCDYEAGVEIVCADKYQDFLVDKYYYHTNYHSTSYNDDIALIRLNRDADYTASNVKPICLPVGNWATLKADQGIVTGWGRTEHGRRSQDLLKVSLKIMPNDECARAFEANRIPIGSRQLCAGGKNRFDSCAGDSGGPFQYPQLINNVPKYIQYGVVSFGTKHCGVEGYPGVYTRVVYYMDWILNTITE